MKKYFAATLFLATPLAAIAADPAFDQIPDSLVRVTASPDYRLLGFANLIDNSMQYDYYLQKLEVGRVVCTRKIEEISGAQPTIYEHWAYPLALKLTMVKDPVAHKAELVTITPRNGCEYTFESRSPEV
ncbi:MAG: hypothetical protein E6R02_05760 [Gammaproteobacteria bacterium]|nr:MAG: hypothetical protein E6R02_05760 [Gammaproteobacteria bacterium]